MGLNIEYLHDTQSSFLVLSFHTMCSFRALDKRVTEYGPGKSGSLRLGSKRDIQGVITAAPFSSDHA